MVVITIGHAFYSLRNPLFTGALYHEEDYHKNVTHTETSTPLLIYSSFKSLR